MASFFAFSLDCDEILHNKSMDAEASFWDESLSLHDIVNRIVEIYGIILCSFTKQYKQ